MAYYRPVNRMSCTSLEDEQFFSACSSQPVSRLMSISASQEQEQLADDVNSAARPSEPLVSVCSEPAETVLSTVFGPLNNPHQSPPLQHRFSPISACCQPNRDRLRQSPAQLRAVSSDEGSSTAGSGHSVDNLVSSPAPAITTRGWSSATGREPCLAACHYQGCLPITSRSQLDGYVSKQRMDEILCHIHAYLSARQYADRSKRLGAMVINENGWPPTQTRLDNLHLEKSPFPEDQYLITTDNITRILDIVVIGVHDLQDDGSQLDYQSLLFPSRTQARPTLQGENIIPSVSTIADPATTICSPRPCFSLADGFKEPGDSCLTRHITYISRQSITEID
ncbi:hypothetical protein F5B18DRAFT_92767 [Nemania serpens]|nr:hypothetical protein F5B18DRAFT_92767 [Nemania serpens]